MRDVSNEEDRRSNSSQSLEEIIIDAKQIWWVREPDLVRDVITTDVVADSYSARWREASTIIGLGPGRPGATPMERVIHALHEMILTGDETDWLAQPVPANNVGAPGDCEHWSRPRLGKKKPQPHFWSQRSAARHGRRSRPVAAQQTPPPGPVDPSTKGPDAAVKVDAGDAKPLDAAVKVDAGDAKPLDAAVLRLRGGGSGVVDVLRELVRSYPLLRDPARVREAGMEILRRLCALADCARPGQPGGMHASVGLRRHDGVIDYHQGTVCAFTGLTSEMASRLFRTAAEVNEEREAQPAAEAAGRRPPYWHRMSDEFLRQGRVPLPGVGDILLADLAEAAPVDGDGAPCDDTGSAASTPSSNHCAKHMQMMTVKAQLSRANARMALLARAQGRHEQAQRLVAAGREIDFVSEAFTQGQRR
jgi:hypothetical protein